MLSILHPSLLPIIKEMPGGILPLLLDGEEYPVLIIKSPKEYILAAKINSGFKIYIAPVIIDNQKTFGIVTAFFDDEDEPLVIKSPLFRDDFSEVLFSILKHDNVNVHLFDELSREQFVYNASIAVPDKVRQQLKNNNLLDFTLPRARLMIDEMERFFGLRTTEDDAMAITVQFNKSVYGDGLFLQDMRPEHHSYHGSRGFSHTVVERDEPGRYQEEDIVQCLLLVFRPEEIYLNPKRTYDNEEMCDILVITDKHLFIIQAKDSPNIERVSKQKLSRKRNNVLSALKKAIKQVRGAVSYSLRNSCELEFLIDDKRYTINTDGLVTKTLIVIKELFNDQFSEYSQLLLGFVREKKVACVALDYPEFYSYCKHLQDEDAFFDAYDRVMGHAVKEEEYPRLRFGLVED